MVAKLLPGAWRPDQCKTPLGMSLYLSFERYRSHRRRRARAPQFHNKGIGETHFKPPLLSGGALIALYLDRPLTSGPDSNIKSSHTKISNGLKTWRGGAGWHSVALCRRGTCTGALARHSPLGSGFRMKLQRLFLLFPTAPLV